MLHLTFLLHKMNWLHATYFSQGRVVLMERSEEYKKYITAKSNIVAASKAREECWQCNVFILPFNIIVMVLFLKWHLHIVELFNFKLDSADLTIIVNLGLTPSHNGKSLYRFRPIQATWFLLIEFYLNKRLINIYNQCSFGCSTSSVKQI